MDCTGECRGRSTYGTCRMTGESLWSPRTSPISKCLPAECAANVWDIASAPRAAGGPMLGGPASPGEKTAQSCLESDGSSLGGGLRRVRRLPVPGLEICP